MAAYVRPEFTRGTLGAGAEADRLHLALVGPGFFELLGTPPVAGRVFQESDFVATPLSAVAHPAPCTLH